MDASDAPLGAQRQRGGGRRALGSSPGTAPAQRPGAARMAVASEAISRDAIAATHPNRKTKQGG